MKRKIRQKIIDQWGKPKDRNFNFNLIDQYAFYKKTDSTTTLSEKAIIDLDIYEYFKFIDRTNSSVGQQYLYHKILFNNANKSDLAAQERLIDFYLTNPNQRIDSQIILDKLSKSVDYYFPFLIFGDLPKKMKSFWIVRFLQFLLIISAALFIKYTSFFIPIILLLTINVGLHYWHKNRIGNFAIYFSRLLKLTASLKKMLPLTSISDSEKSELLLSVKLTWRFPLVL